jgi:hypothetical protein
MAVHAERNVLIVSDKYADLFVEKKFSLEELIQYWSNIFDPIAPVQ